MTLETNARERRRAASRAEHAPRAAEEEGSTTLRTLLDEAIVLTGAERGFLLEVRRSSPDLELEVLLARGFGGEALPAEAESICTSAVARALTRSGPVSTANPEDRDLLARSSARHRRVRAILCLPLGGRPQRFLYLDHRFLVDAFSCLDLDPLLDFVGSPGTELEFAL